MKRYSSLYVMHTEIARQVLLSCLNLLSVVPDNIQGGPIRLCFFLTDSVTKPSSVGGGMSEQGPLISNGPTFSSVSECVRRRT